MSTTPFSNTGALDKSVALSEYTASIDQVAEPYFNTLSKFTRHARRLQIKDEEGEKKLLEYLPVNERMSLEKEQKVLARWQERQKDWERIESSIGKKITAKLMGHRINKSASGKPLMMTTTDEYRAKLEEYDLIQAAIPLEDKFADNWQMSLRGGGPIHVAIGHIFSGLECEIDLRTTAPKMVRKPKILSAVGKNDTFLEQTENLLRKRKKYEKNIATIRPHSLTYRDANNLVVKSMNLFQWAQESSQEYISSQKELLLSTLMEEEAMQERLRAEERKAAEALERERFLLAQNKGPKIEYLSPLDILFETEVNKTIQRSVTFRNVGTTTLYYRWKKLKVDKDQKTDDGKNKKDDSKEEVTQGANSEKISHVLDAKGRADSSLLTRVLNQARDSFFCLRECGEILPGETIETTFIFDSRAGGGIFNCDWLLEMTPDESRIVIAVQANAGPQSVEDGKGNGKNSTSSSHIKIGCITIHLHGHCIVPDQAMLKREHVENSIDRHTMFTSVQDIVLDCIRQVRSPLRPKEIETRIINYFQLINKSLFKIVFVSPKARASIERDVLVDNRRVYDNTIDVYAHEDDVTLMSPLFVTIARIVEFEELHHKTAIFFDTILQHYDAVLNDAGKLDERISVINEFSVNPMKFNHIMASIFPENKLECFDEVEMSHIEPHWPYDISLSSNALNRLRPIVAHIDELEQFIAKRNADEEKARLKAERLAKKRASGDSDDEEEEEEEPEEEEKALFVKKHALLVELNKLYGQIMSKLHQLTLHPLALGKVDKVVSNELCSTFDKITEFQEDALKQAGIFEAFNNFMSNAANGGNITGLIPVAPNPFESEENNIHWEKMLALTTPNSEPVVPDKKAAKPAKNAPPPATATPQQIDYYHKILYENIRGGILDALDRVLDSSMPGIKQEVEETFHTYTQIASSVSPPPTSVDLNSTSTNLLLPDSYPSILAKVGTYRKEDVEDGVVFYSIDADRIVNPPTSAFDVRSISLSELGEEIISLFKHDAKMVTLLYESPYDHRESGPHSSLHSLQGHVDSIRDVIQKKLDEYIVLDQKQRKKLKIKDIKQYKKVDVHFYSSFAELYYHVDHFLRFGNQELGNGSGTNIKTKEEYFNSYLPIIILENLRCPNVYPSEPKFEEVDSDDEFPSITIGKDEYKQRDRRKYVNRRPQRVAVSFNVVRTNPHNGSRSTVKQTQEVYCNPTAALQELFALAKNQNDKRVWIDGQLRSFHSRNHACYSLHAHLEHRLVSHHAREALLWCAVLQSLVYFPQISQHRSELSLNPPSIATLLPGETSPLPVHNFADYLSYFFPETTKNLTVPRSLVVLGGELRIDKLRVLDELITMVRKV